MEIKKPKAVIVDIDGVVLTCPYIQDIEEFYEKMDQCVPVETIVDFVYGIQEHGYAIIFVTARREEFWNKTYETLKKLFIFPFSLYMRKNEDLREDFLIKEEYLCQLEKEYEVKLAIDDSPDNISMFNSHGIRTFLVNRFE